MYKIYGIASGNGAETYGSQLGVWNIYHNLQHLSLRMDKVFHTDSIKTKLDIIPELEKLFKQVNKDLKESKNLNDKYLFYTGDHSNGIAVWSSISNLINKDIGLIWIDSHLDCHTPSTSASKNIHGMPVAHLMGYGDNKLSSLIKHKIKPENFCYIGVNSYEQEEIEFIKKHNIKTFFMKDINTKNINDVFNSAVHHVTKNTDNFGVSFDLDSISNNMAPGTGYYNHKGLDLHSVLHNLDIIAQHKKFCGIEITEYNPLLDVENKTLKAILDITKIII